MQIVVWCQTSILVGVDFLRRLSDVAALKVALIALFHVGGQKNSISELSQ